MIWLLVLFCKYLPTKYLQCNHRLVWDRGGTVWYALRTRGDFYTMVINRRGLICLFIAEACVAMAVTGLVTAIIAKPTVILTVTACSFVFMVLSLSFCQRASMLIGCYFSPLDENKQRSFFCRFANTPFLKQLVRKNQKMMFVAEEIH